MVSVHLDFSEMPSTPILVNKKTLKQRTQLFVFQKDKQKCENNRETEQELVCLLNDLLAAGRP